MPAPPLNPRLHALYGWKPVTVAAADGALASDLDVRVDRLLHEPGWNPPLLPEVGRGLLEIVNRGRVDGPAAHRVLALDPLVTARMMQRAQREAGKRRQVLVPADVVDVLGPDGVGRLALETASHGRVFRAHGYLEAASAVRRHALATAHTAAMLAEYLPHAATSPADAWTRMFLADTGLQVALIALGTGTAPVPAGVSWPSCVEAHTRIGVRVLRAWGLGEPLLHVVEHHHTDVDTEATELDRPLALYQLAEALVAELGLAVQAGVPGGAGECEPDRAWRAAERVLGVHVTAIGGLREDARGLLQRQGIPTTTRARATG